MVAVLPDDVDHFTVTQCCPLIEPPKPCGKYQGLQHRPLCTKHCAGFKYYFNEFVEEVGVEWLTRMQDFGMFALCGNLLVACRCRCLFSDYLDNKVTLLSSWRKNKLCPELIEAVCRKNIWKSNYQRWICFASAKGINKLYALWDEGFESIFVNTRLTFFPILLCFHFKINTTYCLPLTRFFVLSIVFSVLRSPFRSLASVYHLPNLSTPVSGVFPSTLQFLSSVPKSHDCCLVPAGHVGV